MFQLTVCSKLFAPHLGFSQFDDDAGQPRSHGTIWRQCHENARTEDRLNIPGAPNSPK